MSEGSNGTSWMRDIRPVEWLLLAQLSAASFLMDRLLRRGLSPRTARWFQRLSHSGWLKRFPLFHRRVPLVRHATLCALAAGAASEPHRSMLQATMFLWMVRSSGHGGRIVSGIDALQAERDAHTPAA